MYSPLIAKLPCKSWTFLPSEKYIEYSLIFHFVYQKFSIDATKFAQEHLMQEEVKNGVFNPEFMSLKTYKHQSKRLESYITIEEFFKTLFVRSI